MPEQSTDRSSESSETLTTCRFYVTRKNRYCKTIPVTDRKYCIQHSHLEEHSDQKKRIPCPLDPKHTIFEINLGKHLKKCNARDKNDQNFKVMNINSGLQFGSSDESLRQISVSEADPGEIISLSTTVKRIFEELNLEVKEFEDKCHVRLQEERKTLNAGLKRDRHLKQVGALLEILNANSLLTSNTTFIEFGAGRGQLAHWIQQCLPQSCDCNYVLIDRGNPRHKFDIKHKWGDGPQFQRLRIDIEHLDLNKVDCLQESSKIVCVSKHLCGDATDLSLRCVGNYNRMSPSSPLSAGEVNSEEDAPCSKRRCLSPSPMRGILIALCCHHRCTWRQYCGQEFFTSLGLTPQQFQLMTRMSTWATCAAKDPQMEDVDAECHKDHKDKEYSHPRYGNLSAKDREEVGYMCKRIIDAGRIHHLQKMFKSVFLFHYVERCDTLENVALLATN